jgi:hypothetical protein
VLALETLLLGDGLSLTSVDTELMHLAHFLIYEKRENGRREAWMKCGGFV